MLCPVAPRIPEPSAIIVAEAFRRSSLRERFDYIEHSLNHRVVRDGNLYAISRSKQACI